MEKEREDNQRRLVAKDKLLSKRALHINNLQGINSCVHRDKVLSLSVLLSVSLSVSVGSTGSLVFRTSK